MNIEPVANVLVLIAGILVSIQTVRSLVASVRQSGNEAAESVTNAAVKLIEAYSERITCLEQDTKEMQERLERHKVSIDDLENRLARRESIIKKLLAGIRILQHQVAAMGKNPLFEIDDHLLAELAELEEANDE